MDEVDGPRPVQQPVEVCGKNSIAFGSSGKAMGPLQIKWHEARWWRPIGQGALVDIENENLIEIESSKSSWSISQHLF